MVLVLVLGLVLVLTWEEGYSGRCSAHSSLVRRRGLGGYFETAG